MLTATAAPDADLDATTALCHRILDLYGRLRAQDSLAPSPVLDGLFGELVDVCVRTGNVDAAAVLADPRIRGARPDLVRLCGEGESLLERVWAGRALAADDPHAELADFPYLDNYRQLTRLELHALAGAGYRPGATRRVCFIGGGPLPLSALLLGRELAAEVTIVDRDADAVDLSRRLLRRLTPAGPLAPTGGQGGAGRPAPAGPLAPAGRVGVVRADAASASDLAEAVAGCDVVVVAALVGTTWAQKRAVLRAVGTVVEPDAYVVVRSAEGLRSLLYPVVETRDVYDVGLTPEVLVHPLGPVVNSVLVTRRR